MYLARGIKRLWIPDNGCVATIGNFDGVHLGHQAVIKHLAEQGHRLNLPTVVILFEPQPREYFMPEQSPARLTRFREKLNQLAKLPVDEVLQLHFDQSLADCPAEDFIRKILVDALKIKYLVVGDDFCFGKKRQGNFAMLQQAGREFGFQVSDTDSFFVAGDRVSSTLVRDALEAGDMGLAATYLGRPYSVVGRVRHGLQLGRKLGFPTANIAMMRKKSPLRGVFAVTMTGLSKNTLNGVANVGSKPTVAGSERVQLETHLFDFSGDIYGRLVEVHFHQKIRDEQRFASIDALREQIERDAQKARHYFAHSEL